MPTSVTTPTENPSTAPPPCTMGLITQCWPMRIATASFRVKPSAASSSITPLACDARRFVQVHIQPTANLKIFARVMVMTKEN